MKPRIETLAEKKLVGHRRTMSFADNKTRELWQQFMPRRKEIQHNIGTNLYSLQMYDTLYFDHFNPNTPFEKWAAMEVTDFDTVPDGMEMLVLPGGLYAVFLYQGAASAGAEVFQYIFGIWLPNADYLLDSRPHFELLGEKYNNENPDSEEEIWIPIQPIQI